MVFRPSAIIIGEWRIYDYQYERFYPVWFIFGMNIRFFYLVYSYFRLALLVYLLFTLILHFYSSLYKTHHQQHQQHKVIVYLKTFRAWAFLSLKTQM